MSKAEANQMDAFERGIKQITSVLSLIKIIAGIVLACAIAVGCSFVWVSQTTSAIASTQARVEKIDAETRVVYRDFTSWRFEIDKQMARIIALQEAQTETNHRLEQLSRQRNP